MMFFTSLLLMTLATFATGEEGQEGYPVLDSLGITHGGVSSGGAVHHGGVVHGGGIVHGGVVGGHFGKKGVVYPPHHLKKGGVVHGGGIVHGGVVGGHFGKKGVVYPPHHLKKGVVYPAHHPKKGVVYPAHHSKKGVVYPPHIPKKGVVYPHIPKKGGGKYPHGNVHVVGGHGYFPDKPPGAKGYGKGYYYKQVANVGPMTLACPYGWQYYHGSCYYFSRERMTWWQAYAKCNFMGGYLAMVNYAHENSYLKLMCKKMKFHDGAWFGLNDVLFPKTHTWYWGFGKKGCKWFDWFGKGPNFRGGDKNCVCFKEDYHYKWSTASCTTKLYYICELNPKKPCKCGY